MEILQVWIVFAFGMCVGAGLFLSYSAYQIYKIRKAKETLMSVITRKAKEMEDKKDSIKERLIAASELAQAQMAIRAQMEMPSKNALHSRYKNSLGTELQDMEEKKLGILRTILAEGFDPMITVINDAGKQDQVPLSSYVDQAATMLNDSRGTPPMPPQETKKVGKFIIHKGGKDDGTTH